MYFNGEVAEGEKKEIPVLERETEELIMFWLDEQPTGATVWD